MSEHGRKSIVIVGGGATGVILAAHLVKAGLQDRITLIEKRDEVGAGLAYSTRLPDHRLNVLASRMGAYADDPLHFWHWYCRTHLDAAGNGDIFLPRETYGRYLSDLFDGLVAVQGASGRLRKVTNECVNVLPLPSGFDVQLADGTSIPAHMVFLATGHDPDPAPRQPFATRLCAEETPTVDPDERVVILGSGLSMIDAWLTLEAHGHRGEIVAISRRGLFPLPHGEKRNPIRLDAADIPLGTDLSYFVRWFATLVEEREREGGDWRDVVDGLRPFNQMIWQNWPISAKQRFLEHTKAWWDIHRHRIPPDVHARASEAAAAGRLRLVAGKVTGVTEEAGGLAVTLRERGSSETETIRCGRIYDCTGFAKDIGTTSVEPVRSLLARGTVRPDPLRIGLDVTPDCMVIGASGRPTRGLYAVGPLTRGTFFEIDAIAEIRNQCARVAASLS